ncbi:hypothetical protein BDY19DRAFT_891094 [Irpex rosettiformis]|uniref:Uncharacterized protein n=1 Tax=Irpex rosettiformis TaxID=378272 RepID=A0ACB8U370_9APHY|nr:hypothetical protein BDY19DRAFT_891094 [Irpex rosettiformis]
MAGTKEASKTFKGKYSKIKDFVKHYERSSREKTLMLISFKLELMQLNLLFSTIFYLYEDNFSYYTSQLVFH